VVREPNVADGYVEGLFDLSGRVALVIGGGQRARRGDR
jgi:hypothetical protein